MTRTLLSLALVAVAGVAWAENWADFMPRLSGFAVPVDGDTLTVGGIRVRLAAVDAPERDQTCGGRACGAEATAALAALVRGQIVSCTPTGRSYNRVVARCSVNGQDIGEAMVRMGHAIVLRRYDRTCRLCNAEADARAARRGIWAGDFVQPAEWRGEHRR